MSNLIPQKRMNKHGVMVTKHVRDDSHGKSGSRMPAPQLGAQKRDMTEVKNRIRDAILDEYEAHGYGEEGCSSEELIERGLSGYSDSVLDAYDKALREYPDAGYHANGYESMLVNTLVHGNTSGEAGYVLFIGKQFTELDTNSYDYALRIYNGLSSVEHKVSLDLVEDIYSPEDADKAASIAALIAVTNAVERLDGKWGMMVTQTDNGAVGEKLENNDLIDLILEHPHHADPIINVISERETTDAKIIKLIIESESPSMSEGAL